MCWTPWSVFPDGPVAALSPASHNTKCTHHTQHSQHTHPHTNCEKFVCSMSAENSMWGHNKKCWFFLNPACSNRLYATHKGALTQPSPTHQIHADTENHASAAEIHTTIYFCLITQPL
eukprot:m.250778 g.250778  ORF g.250778 m.250778 type:complete len:118 (+) comp17180_c0_seq2:2996-3349(+)